MPAEITVTGANAGRAFIYALKRIASRFTAGFALLCVLPSLASAADYLLPAEFELQRSNLRASLVEPDIKDNQSAALRLFYRQRDYAPVWIDPKRLMELSQLEKLAELHGLDPSEYALTELGHRAEQIAAGDSGEGLAELELQVSDSIARLASHLRYGKVDVARRYPVLRTDAADSTVQTAELLAAAAMSESLFAYLNSLAPDTLLYRALQSSLVQHRNLQNQGSQWLRMPSGATLEPGMTDPRVAILRQRLGTPIAGADAVADDFYDAELAQAVADFQIGHALTGDGLAGKQTVSALNVSIPERISQLRVNLEWQRWAAMPAEQEYLLVNVAQFKMHLVENGERTWSTRTQVGRYKRQTPAFKSALTGVVANPSWTVPPTIFREDILPKVQADPEYLQRQNMRVIDARGQTVDSQSVDWQQTTAADFPYRLRAKPGKGNALGRLKFQIPNPYLIYLHDTPSRRLFKSDVRAFSSGCIRLEEPEQLAQLIIQRQTGISAARLNSALASKRTRHIDLDTPMPVVVMYGTVDLNTDGDLVFAHDVYRRDRRVLAALNTAQPDERDTILLAGLTE